VAQGYGHKDKVVAEGRSAGGLLMGAISNMAPVGLYTGIVAGVPFVDVITTMMDATIPLTTGEWEEWGNPITDKAAYDYMLSYSPYDQVSKKAYPHMLVTTSINDSRVAYWEPAKWVAKLRTMKTDKNALLLKTDLDAGHGGGSGRDKRYEDTAYAYAFGLHVVGLAE
jgi:oligopeptidase B